ncbi:MAG: B12-binding domain-containing radical SAM protein [Elusimicrobia bacterium]|nr:B12-binding domain-containing radical SAM protein [Elusimicrobiota bacterium]
MKQNIVLIQPQIGDMDVFRDKPTPPLGLLCAASIISGETEVKIIDQRLDKNWRQSLSRALNGETIAAGITTMTGKMISHGIEAAREIRKLSDKPVIWGGIHPSIFPEQTLQHGLVDYVVEGEGEFVFAELVRRLAAGKNIEDVPGIWYKKQGEIKTTGRAPLIDLNALPPAPYHLIDMERYFQTYRGKRMFFYQSSRGCPCDCAYCYNRSFSLGRFRTLDVKRVLEELASLKTRHNFELVYFIDDNFFVDKKRALEIISGLKELKLGSVFQGVDVESMARLSDRELDFLEEAGVERMTIGIESGTDRLRIDILNKAGSIDLVLSQIDRFKNRNIIILFSMMIGLPTETPEETRKTIELGLEILEKGDNFRTAQFYIYSPYPGTELFSALQQQGAFLPSTMEEWGIYEWDYSNMHKNQPVTKDFLERAAFLSKFLDKKMDDYGSGGKSLKLLYNLYRPIARARLKTGFISPLPERWSYQLLKKIY